MKPDIHITVSAYCMTFMNKSLDFFLADKIEKNSMIQRKTVRRGRRKIKQLMLHSCGLLWHTNWDYNQNDMITLLVFYFQLLWPLIFPKHLKTVNTKNGILTAFSTQYCWALPLQKTDVSSSNLLTQQMSTPRLTAFSILVFIYIYFAKIHQLLEKSDVKLTSFCNFHFIFS